MTEITSPTNLEEIAAMLTEPEGYHTDALVAARRIAIRYLLGGVSHEAIVAAAMASADRDDTTGAKAALGGIDVSAYRSNADRQQILIQEDSQ